VSIAAGKLFHINVLFRERDLEPFVLESFADRGIECIDHLS